ncbi:unnamed protein product [Linum trigynum]|uniref:Uncharacterized protein n=1 Tax=Linum trigynum TaxID=586398 RepID=A0AAV2EER7_9ROSI
MDCYFVRVQSADIQPQKIILQDEAMSTALYTVSENLVQEALERMVAGRTCMMVAHRGSLQNSDSIAVIKNGQVAEEVYHIMSSCR